MNTPTSSELGGAPERATIPALIEQLQASCSCKPKGQWRVHLCAVLYGLIVASQGTQFLILFCGVLVVVFMLDCSSEQRIHGLGGIFFKARNPSKLGAWYQKHLGLPIEAWGGFAFQWRDAKNPKKKGSTVWCPFDADTKYFGPGRQGHMVNYRVASLKKVLAVLKKEGVWIDPKGINASE